MSHYDPYEGRPDLVEKYERASKWVRGLIALTCVYGLIVLSVVFINTILSLSARHTLLDCTQPTGHCYQQGQQRSSQILRTVTLTLICQDKPGQQTEEQITRCVQAHLKKEGHK